MACGQLKVQMGIKKRAEMYKHNSPPKHGQQTKVSNASSNLMLLQFNHHHYFIIPRRFQILRKKNRFEIQFTTVFKCSATQQGETVSFREI